MRVDRRTTPLIHICERVGQNFIIDSDRIISELEEDIAVRAPMGATNDRCIALYEVNCVAVDLTLSFKLIRIGSNWIFPTSGTAVDAAQQSRTVRISYDGRSVSPQRSNGIGDHAAAQSEPTAQGLPQHDLAAQFQASLQLNQEASHTDGALSRVNHI